MDSGQTRRLDDADDDVVSDGSVFTDRLQIIHTPDDLTVSTAPAHRRTATSRRRWWLLLAVLVAATAGYGLWSWRQLTAAPAGRLAITQTSGGPLITVTAGSLNLGQLRSRLNATGHGSYLQPAAGGGDELTTDLTVGKGGRVSIDRTALLLRSDSQVHVRIFVQGGRLELRRDTIVSWSASSTVDVSLSDGRADIVAQGAGSQLDFTNSTVSFLGANTNDPGVSWRAGAGGKVSGSTFKDDFRGAYAYQSGPLTITDSTFSSSTEDGFLMLYPSARTTVTSSNFDNNAANGLELNQAPSVMLDGIEASGNTAGVSADAGHGLHVQGALLHNNKQQGMTLTNVAAVRVTGSKFWANSTGLTISGGLGTVKGSDFSGNVVDGLYLTGPTAQLTLQDDRLDHNERSGLWLADGKLAMTTSVFDTNETGIELAASTAGLNAHGNTIEASVKDGVALTGLGGVTFASNTIKQSGDAAISVAAKTNLQAIIAANTVAKGQIVSRVRAS